VKQAPIRFDRRHRHPETSILDHSCDNPAVGATDANETVLYEVNLDADAAIEGPFDTWLRDHAADMLQLDGFLSAEILADPAPPPGRVRRSVQYRLANQAALDQYLQLHAPEMRRRGTALFGDAFKAQRRVLAHREEFVGRVSTENCLNCGEVLTGQHCAHCGQRAKVRVLSLGSLLRDLFGDLTEFDSRIWRTLRPLALKPGWLTTEYLRGRRTLYTPPFRMYLVLSVLFFLATSLGADPGSAIAFGPDGTGGANVRITDGGRAENPAANPAAQGGEADLPSVAGDGAVEGPPRLPDTGPESAPIDEDRQRIIDAVIRRLPEAQQAQARRELENEIASMSTEDAARLRRVADDPCGEDNLQLETVFADKYEPRLREACRKIMADSKTFGRALYDNLPKMMFIFLPLIAGVMFVLYLGSGRYYVEHLLFFVHYHSFFFLAGFVGVVLDRGAALLEGTVVATSLRFVEGVLWVVLVVYVPFYLYRAMRRVYGQGRIVTLLKFSMLGIGYVVFMGLTAVGLLAYTALTL
jgi:hypothetical protein